MEVSSPTTIYCDKLSSVQLARNLVFHTWTKHIEVHYHFVRERIFSGEVEPVYVPIGRQIADIFTKPLDLDKLRQFSGALGLRHLVIPNLRGDRNRSMSVKGAEVTIAAELTTMSSRMKNSISDRLQKPKKKIGVVKVGKS